MRDPRRDPIEGDILVAPPVNRTVTFVGLLPFNQTGGVIEVRYQETRVGRDTVRNGWCFLRSWRSWAKRTRATPLGHQQRASPQGEGGHG